MVNTTMGKNIPKDERERLSKTYREAEQEIGLSEKALKEIARSAAEDGTFQRYPR